MKFCFTGAIRRLRPRSERGVRPSIFVKFLLCLFYLLCGSLAAFSLDREAFSFTHYDLNVQLDTEQHRVGVRGKVTLRNDTATPQKVAVLQVSSSLNWRAIKVAGKQAQFLTQPFASDMDHTGGLSEAVLTLPQAIAPHGTVEVEIAYEGVIDVDATRLTRIGTPEDAAASTDWDRISPEFTALRGAGNVAWYPVATDVANLSEGDSLFEVLARWKDREAWASMKIDFAGSIFGDEADSPTIVCSGKVLEGAKREGANKIAAAQCTFDDFAHAPSFAVAHYGVVTRPSVTIYNFGTHAVAAEAYADAGENLVPLIREWLGAPREKVQVVDLPDPQDAPFESGALLFTPLSSSESTRIGLAMAHQLGHASFHSARPWIEEGLAHFVQALYLEQERGRRAALDYLSAHRAALVEAESADPKPEDAVNHSLVNTIREDFYRSKAMDVWWMLRDMVGDAALKKALGSYRPEQDKEPSYMQKLIATHPQRDLEWFFDDWVYRDRGLPDFKVESAFSRKTLKNSYILAVTVDNLGAAGAEVPVIVKFAGGEIAKRLEVRAKDKATIRVETPAGAQEVVVNDGSVPESDVSNNTFRVAAVTE
jgi:hypothetical protein